MEKMIRGADRWHTFLLAFSHLHCHLHCRCAVFFNCLQLFIVGGMHFLKTKLFPSVAGVWREGKRFGAGINQDIMYSDCGSWWVEIQEVAQLRFYREPRFRSVIHMYFVYLGPTSDKPQASCFFFSYVQTLGLTAGDRSIYSLLLQATTTRDLISACSLIFGPAGCCIQTSTSQISVLLTPHWYKLLVISLIIIGAH